MANAGNVSKLSRCTPIDKPAEYTANNTQRSDCGVSGRWYHFTMAHSVSAVKKVDMAYTSPSTAENQMEVEKAVAKPAAKPAATSAMFWPRLVSASRLPVRENLPKIMAVQATSMAAAALHRAESRLIETAISAGSSEIISATQVNMRPMSRNTGAPGG